MISGGIFIEDPDYLRRHLNFKDYYEKRNTANGRWIGSSCENFGIKSGTEINEHEFILLLDNKNPATGAQLAVRKNIPAGSGFYDFIVSAPKSFSVLAVTGGVEIVRQWHRTAVEVVLDEMEKFAVRQSHSGKTSEKLEHTKNFCAAAFSHDANSVLEPQLHEHVIIFNATHSADGRNYALDSYEFFPHCGYLTAVYRNELARHAIEGSVEIEFDKRKTPQIEGMAELVEHFSSRTNGIKKFIGMCENITGFELSKAEKKCLSLPLRKIIRKKSVQIKPVTKIQRILLNEISSKIRNAEAKTVDYEDEKDLNIAAVEYALQDVFERKYIVPETQILQAALTERCGRIASIEEFKEDFRNTCSDLGIVSLGPMLTPAGYIEAENEIMDYITQGKNKHVDKINNYTVSDKLSLEQKETVEAIINSQDKFTVLAGNAGVGKRLLLTEIVNAYIESDIPVFIFAPSNEAEDILTAYGKKLRIESNQLKTAETFENTQTLQSLFRSENAITEIRPGSFVILEETDSASLMQIYKFSNLSYRHDWKVLFTGTLSQHNSDETGNAFRMILTYSGIKQFYT